MKTLVLGGARSGKSRHAEQLVMKYPAPWVYLATAQVFDDEMRGRIETHRQRRDVHWQTVDAPLDLPEKLAQHPDTPVLIDCLTLWLTNLMLGGHDIPGAAQRLIQTLCQRISPAIIVSNEVGLGIVPDNALARRFRDAAGTLNQDIAAMCDDVWLVAAGLPLKLKG